MKLTRRAARQIRLVVTTRCAEKDQTPKLDYDKLMQYVLPID